jgi:hypothetical protein
LTSSHQEDFAVSNFQPSDYGPIFAPLLETDRCRPLDEGSAKGEVRDQLVELTVAEAFAHVLVNDSRMARCCISGLWLLYDFLDESHTISQGIPTVDGSYWHGIMHRREGDFSNSKYWFRKVGEHPVFALLDDDWDPFDFVDACQAALRSGGAEEQRCCELQQREWELLFDYCYRHALK